MKRIVTTLILAILVQFAMNAQDLKVISYNIRYSEAKDGTNSWVYRYAASAEMMQDQQADVIGLQEAASDQIEFVEQNFKEYKAVGKYASVLWNKKTVSLLKSGSLDAATWTLIKHKKTGNRFYLVNVDMEKTPDAERKGVLRQILDKVAELNTENIPVVVTGGFYMKPSDPDLSDINSEMINARTSAAKTDNTGTYHNWGKCSDIIDHIYYSSFSDCLEYQTVTTRYADRKFVSDHYPIMTLLTF
ncbi:MAG: endonuclease/exonuclease/phosphatase family protein [Bacteroidales bacterium]|nr:endonuclease/exonuclease/phosphatase family protein [Bacteroidales bacterium]